MCNVFTILYVSMFFKRVFNFRAEYLSAGRVGGGLNPAVWSSSYQNQVYCQLGFRIQGICFGVLVHNNKYGTRI